MTIRAILLGLLGACFVCGFTYFNDAVMRQTYFVGNNMPIAVYGGLTVITATHDHKMLAVSDRIVWIRDGGIEKIQRRSELDIRTGTVEVGEDR